MEGLISSFCNIFDSVCGAMTRLVASGLVEGVEEVKKAQICIKIVCYYYELRVYHFEPDGSKGFFFQILHGSVIIVINLII